MQYIDLEELVELAEKGHLEEIVTYNITHTRKHDPIDCRKCLNIYAVKQKFRDAERAQSSVVLYIP